MRRHKGTIFIRAESRRSLKSIVIHISVSLLATYLTQRPALVNHSCNVHWRHRYSIDVQNPWLVQALMLLHFPSCHQIVSKPNMHGELVKVNLIDNCDLRNKCFCLWHSWGHDRVRIGLNALFRLRFGLPASFQAGKDKRNMENYSYKNHLRQRDEVRASLKEWNRGSKANKVIWSG